MTQTAVTPVNTCFICPNFNNLNESNGRGWCELFNYQAREHHEMTNDCIVSSETAIQQRETSAININRERELITIEFAPDIHPEETEYSYEHPQFVFGDRVFLVNSFPKDEYIVCGLELMESKTPSAKLLNQPFWKYKISNGKVSYWKDETALVRCKEHQAKTLDRQTNDCILNSPVEEIAIQKIEDELDLTHSDYKVGNFVKVIDPAEDHTEWAVFEIVGCKHNESLYRSTESYPNESQWYYRLVSHVDSSTISKSLWVREDEICQFDIAHNICTEDIF